MGDNVMVTVTERENKMTHCKREKEGFSSLYRTTSRKQPKTAKNRGKHMEGAVRTVQYPTVHFLDISIQA